MEPVLLSFHMHFLCIGIIESALTQLAIEANKLSRFILNFFDVVSTDRLDILLRGK